jgi:copper chaperone CopZ
MKVVFAVEGMHCDGCVRRVKNLLSKVEGVASAEVSLGEASLEAASSSAEEAARAALVKAGYGVRTSQTQ